MEELVDLAVAASYQIECGQGTGSGWGVTLNQGQEEVSFIVTNSHVVEECLDQGSVTVWDSNDFDFTAEIISHQSVDHDPDSETWEQDLALLEPSIKGYRTIRDLASNYQLGSWVMVSGYPGIGSDYDSIVLTTGIISSDAGLLGYTTTAAINPGSSGSMVMNSRGQVIGIVYAGYEENFLNDNGFFLPLNRLYSLISQLQKSQG